MALAVVAATMAVVVRSSQDPEHRRFSLGHLEARCRRAVVASLADAGREETIAAEPVDGESPSMTKHTITTSILRAVTGEPAE